MHHGTCTRASGPPAPAHATPTHADCPCAPRVLAASPELLPPPCDAFRSSAAAHIVQTTHTYRLGRTPLPAAHSAHHRPHAHTAASQAHYRCTRLRLADAHTHLLAARRLLTDLLMITLPTAAKRAPTPSTDPLPRHGAEIIIKRSDTPLLSQPCTSFTVIFFLLHASAPVSSAIDYYTAR